MKKTVKALHDAALKLNKAAFQYRSLTAMNKGLPQYEYETTASGVKRMPKTLSYHPTKKVAKSEKKRTIEEQTTLALVNLRNAKEEFRLAEENAGR